MPKAGFSRDDMYVPKVSGFVETVGSSKLGEVTGCVSRFVQWQANKKTGAQTAPLTSVILSIAAIDAAGNHIAEPVEQELVAQWGPKDNSLIKVRPGLADSRDGDAADTVDENGNLVLNTEGNCLYVEEGTKINMTNSFGVFVMSCQEKGFKPQILNAGYLPDFIGMRAKFNLKPGRSYTDAGGSQKTAEDFVAEEITRFPYEAAAKPKGKPAGKPAAAPTPTKAAAPVASTSKPNGAAVASADTESICVNLLKQVNSDITSGAKANDSFSRGKLVVMAVQKMLAPASGIEKTKENITAIQAMLKDESWFAENSVSFGAVNTGDDAWMMVGE